MGEIIFDAACTLNGYLAAENHSLDWLFQVPGAQEPDPSLYPSDATVHVQGANTYLWMLEHEELLAHPDRWQELYGQRPTFVFSSRTLPIPRGADVRVRDQPVARALEEIRRAAGEGDIWVFGGGELVGEFFDAKALDRLALTIAPVTLAGGAPVLPRNIAATQLQLMHCAAAGEFARLVYEVRYPDNVAGPQQ